MQAYLVGVWNELIPSSLYSFYLICSMITTGVLVIPVKQNNLYRPTIQSVIMTCEVQYSYSTHLVPISNIGHYA